MAEYSKILKENLVKKYRIEEINLTAGEQVIDIDLTVAYAVGELITNSVEKGATHVRVVLEGSTIDVSDNIIHPADSVGIIIANVNSESPISTKPPGSYGQTEHGNGIFYTRHMLRQDGHDLLFRSNKGNIIAQINLGTR